MLQRARAGQPRLLVLEVDELQPAAGEQQLGARRMPWPPLAASLLQGAPCS
jgi:hypothetical protein